MASPANADRSSAHSSGSSQAHSDDTLPTGAFGPLTVTRHVKDDGRALLLYTHRHNGGGGGDEAGDRPT